jgi:hypothetical protein
MKTKKPVKKQIRSLKDLPEKQQEMYKEFYQHIARAMMLCQSAIHSLDDVKTNAFNKHMLTSTINTFMRGIELYADVFVETNNIDMVQSFSNIVEQIDQFKQEIKVSIV